MSYAIAGIISLILHLIINDAYFRNKKEEIGEAGKEFKRYLWAVLCYYAADASWGFIYDLHIPLLIYINTLFFYLTMAATVVLLCRYVTAYLKLKTGSGRIINGLGLAFGILDITFLVINHFVPIFFRIDAGGIYHAYGLRYVVYVIQAFLVTFMAAETGSMMRKAAGGMKKRYFTICLFCLEMAIAIVGQILYPLIPMYSIGLVIGICILHTFVEEDEREEQYKILLSMADIHYSMHVIDLVNDTVIEFNAKHEVKEIVDHTDGAAEMMVQVMTTVTEEEDLEQALAFTDLGTVAERMKNKKTISASYRGKRTGWFLAMFIAIETDPDGKPTKVIFTSRIVDEEKKQEEKLIYKSQTDELTGLFNRRTYEEDICKLTENKEDYIYIALDVNGLKAVNDTIGHAAGDELITGASECMKRAFGPYGKLYRTGGDEFAAIITVGEEKLREILADFDGITENWSGELVNSLSVSYGYASRKEYSEFSASKIATKADQRMYLSKALYYQMKGVDRRGQQDAHRALYETYTKILRINLTDDSYQIVNMYEEEKNPDFGFADRISTWLQEFGLTGQVHPDDLDEYLKKTDLAYMREYFRHNSTHIVTYRRKYGDVYKRVMLEIIPANDFTDDNQKLFLYVKRIDK